MSDSDANKDAEHIVEQAAVDGVSAGHGGDPGTGHSPDAHGHDAHGHDAVEEDEPVEEPKKVPAALYIAPIIIFILVILAIWGPVTNAFSKYGNQPAVENSGHGEPESLVSPTAAAEAGLVTQPTSTLAAAPPTNTAQAPTNTAIPPTNTIVAATNTAVPPTNTAVAPTATAEPSATPTSAVAALPPGFGDTANGALRSLQINGQTFTVQTSDLVPDWVFSQDQGVASWVDGTVINYLVGLPTSDANNAIFAALKPGDQVQLTLAGGEVYTFQIDSTGRISKEDTSVLAQDHPALTLLLLGEAGADRAVAQAHYVESGS